MDRYDEKKHMDADEVESREGREGDVLGLSGSSVPKMPGDPRASNDPEAVRRRRMRARETEAEGVRDDDPYQQGKGATGIDMGAGGRGTDYSGE
jgi:hypothetical protein